MVLFGALSLLLGLIQFNIPGVEGGITDLREIALLTSVFYQSHPVYLVGVSAITSIGTVPGGSVLSTFLMHAVALVIMWYYHQYLSSRSLREINLGVAWGAGVIVYYMALVLPIMVGTNKLVGVNETESFTSLYTALASNVQFELIASALITSLYLVQLTVTRKLKENLILLEQRNKQLTRSAFINSHLLRAPLARLLGLAGLIRKESNKFEDPQVIERFTDSCNELDQVVKVISETLEEDGAPESEELETLQRNIQQIVNKSPTTKE